MGQNQHLSQTGLVEIMNLAFQMNPSGTRKYSYQDLVQQMGVSLSDSPTLSTCQVRTNLLNLVSVLTPDPWWITGFADGEASFYVTFSKGQKNVKRGPLVSLRFEISQHGDSLKTLEAIKTYFGCGNIHLNTRDGIYHYTVSKLSELIEHVIPHFFKYPLKTNKATSFVGFCEISNKMKNGAHLNCKGLEEIIEIGYAMNPSGTRKFPKEFWIQACRETLNSKLKV